MRLPHALTRRLRAFAADTRGNMTVEAVIWTPLIVILLLATWMLYDATRQRSLIEKAAFSVADALSRETEAVDDAYVDGMAQMLGFVTQSTEPRGLRITLVRYNAKADRLMMDWSEARDGLDPYRNTQRMRQALADRLSPMAHGERLIVVETRMTHTLPFRIAGLDDYVFEGFALRRPRFAPQIPFQDAGV